MAEFLARPLELLDKLYDIRGGQIRTRYIDLSGITVVHDVSQDAAQARSNQLTTEVMRRQGIDVEGSDAYIYNTTTSTGAGTFFDAIDPIGDLPDLGEDVDVWMTGFDISCGAGDVNSGAVAIVRDSQAATAGTRPYQLLLFTDTQVQMVSGGTEAFYTVGEYFNSPRFPIRLNSTRNLGADRIALRFSFAQIGDVYTTVRYIVTPRGIAPSWRMGSG